MKNPSPAQRRWAYNVAIAVCALLAAYGVIEAEHVLLWNAAFAALFGVARANVPSDE